MQILDLSELSDGSPFCIKRVITDNDNYFAEIQPLQSKFKIQIDKADYKTILDAFQSNKVVKIYPFDGRISNNNEFVNGNYKIEIA